MNAAAKVRVGRALVHPRTCRSSSMVVVRAATEAAKEGETEERFRLNNLSPAPGSKRAKKRIGRGYGAGQGGSAGKGMRGQNARSGGGTRPGFEGGQNPLYRRLPKLKGIAGGMGAGVKDYNVVNVGVLSENFAENEEVTLEALAEKRVIDVSGRERSLPLKVLGDGEIDKKLVVKAVAFSKSASEKIAAAGGEVVTLPGRKKWTRAEHEASKKAQGDS
ncbi:ribosomal protein L15 [Chloropicon primus]|nr:ribosomal protein L15 [Chloropicon primus]